MLKKFTKQTKRQYTGTLSLFSPDADLDPAPTYYFSGSYFSLDAQIWNLLLIKVVLSAATSLLSLHDDGGDDF